MTQPKLYDATYFERMRGHASHADDSKQLLYRRFFERIGASGAIVGKVLDAGCGRGELLEFFRDAGVRDLWGLDFSSEAVQQSKNRLRGTLEGEIDRRIVVGSLDDQLLFPKGHFDLIILTDVVEHLPPLVLSKALANARYWLRPGGRLFVHTFPTLGPHQIYRLSLRLRGNRAGLAELDDIHCNVQTRSSLRRSLVEAGFSIQRLWLENDLTLTSTEFQALPEGIFKSAVRTLFERVLGSAPVTWLLSLLHLEEFARPSIYASCTKSQQP